jgi:aspartyl-tRNA synthetase
MEMSFAEEEDIFSITENMFYKIFKELKGIDIPLPFPRLSYKDAIEQYKTDKPDLRKNKEDFAFVWIIDFPLFQFNESEKRWDSEHHPFTSFQDEDMKFIENGEFDKIRSRSYDLVLNGSELGSGSVRIHKQDVQSKIFDIIGFKSEEAKKRFGFLLKAFQYGAPPHAGVAYGVDRLVAILAGLDSIRDTMAFPKTQKGNCLLTEAPSEVDDKQLKELGIRKT